jgi:hypothetical protein
MDIDVDNLKRRLEAEEAHLKWFIETDQRMRAGGVDTTQEYRASVGAVIARLKTRISRQVKSRHACRARAWHASYMQGSQAFPTSIVYFRSLNRQPSVGPGVVITSKWRPCPAATTQSVDPRGVQT